MRISLLTLCLLCIVSCNSLHAQAGNSLAADPASGSTRVDEKEILAITQALLDAVVSGDTIVWDRYMAADGFITEEDGVVRTKQEQLRFMRPLTKGYTRKITITHPVLKFFENTAVLCIVPADHLEVGGQAINTTYNETDVFVRNKGEWQLLSSHVAEILAPPGTILPDTQALADYAGTYQLAAGITFLVYLEDGKLYGQRQGRSAQQLLGETIDVFFTREQLAHRRIFVRNGAGQVIRMIDRRAGNDLVWNKISAAGR